MPFASRNIVVLAKAEVTSGNYTSPNAADAVLIGSDVSIRQNVGKIDRDNLREVMGSADNLNGFVYDEWTFSTELAASGTAGTPPAWGVLMRAAGFAQTIVGTTLVHYTPVSEAMESLSMSSFFGGVRRNLRGARVRRVVFSLGVNTIPRATWTVIGVPRLAPDDSLVVASAPVPSFSTWKLPRVILGEGGGTQPVTLGASLNQSTGVITGGTAQASKGMTVTVENDCSARPFLGWSGDNCPIVDRDIKIGVTFDLDATRRVEFFDSCLDNTYQSLSQVLGGTSYPGETIKFFSPKAQLMDPENTDDAGLLLSGYTFNVLPNTGNDDLFITCM